MTADVFPASGIVERSAAAFAASVPTQPADDGYFGPASVTWRLNGDISGPVAGLRSLLIQALHPLAMAGVEQHSDWRADPAGRLASTSAYLVAITYGDRATADRAAQRVRKIHERVHGTDPVTGRPYDANDPALLVWVHAALVDSVPAAAELVGVPAGRAPASMAELDAYFAAVRPELTLSPVVAESTAALLDTFAADPDLSDFWRQLADAAHASMPRWVLEIYGYSGESVVDRDEVRQILGVLDVLYLGEPGVLEARQRIELRMRQAGR